MKFTLSWLNEFVPTNNLSPEQLADRLTMLGLEVDSIEKLHGELDSIRTAKIVSVRPHENADRLQVCDVDTGDEVLQIVCGAPNARAGLVTALAPVGSRLPDGTKIKKAKVRGQQSHGMLCSASELGINGNHSGIMELDSSIRPGLVLSEVLGIKDTVVEVDLTPNRPDCASVIGIAREVAAVTATTLKTIPEPQAGIGKADFSVTITDQILCPRYVGRKLSSIKIGPSPSWLQRRLLAVGMRPINNVVDITNYVMLEHGQPLHAFDFNKLGGGAIIVRTPRVDETTFTTLDGMERSLDPEMLLICDAEKPVAIAGVMGGLNSEVGEETTDILLEAACFNPVSVRRTARKLSLPSEASYRFERGVDVNGVLKAMDRAVALMIEFAGATAEGIWVDEYPGKKEPIILELRVKRVGELLGIDLDASQLSTYLTSIEFKVTPIDESVLRVIVPDFRVDIEREIDLVEEVARLVGYNDIPVSLPRIEMDYPEKDSMRILRKDIASLLTSTGLMEAVNYSFDNPANLDACQLPRDDSRRNCVALMNPLSEEQAVMRSMLLPGMLQNVKHNLNQQQTGIRLFEIGKVFRNGLKGQLPIEHFQLCVVICGDRYPGAKPLHFSGLQADFFDIKGVAEFLLQSLRITQGNGLDSFTIPDSSNRQPYCDTEQCLQIVVNDHHLGRVGKLDTAVGLNFGIKQPVYFLEMDLEVLNGLPRRSKSFTILPRYPIVKRDIALLVPHNVSAGDLLTAVYDQKIKYIEHADLFDVYSGKPIEKGMKSVALSVTYRSREGTLDDELVDSFHEKIVRSLMTRFGGRYREG